MKCWECNEEGTKQFDLKQADIFLGETFGMKDIAKRWYCEKCFERVQKERKEDRQEYIRLKKKLMYERAVRMLERQDVDLYDYKEALEAVRDLSERDPDKFDSSHEMVAAAVIIYNEIHVKVHYKIAGAEPDFFIPDLKIVLEVDGYTHKHSTYKDNKKDLKIRNELGYDYEVVRIDTKYIEQNAELLVEAIKSIREEKQKVRKQNGGILPDWYSKRK